MNIFRLFWNMIVYMIGWGVLGGAALGALYGMLVGFVTMLDFERGLNFNALFHVVYSSIVLGVPFGAIFGAIAGGMIGIVNGFSASVLTRMIFSLSRNWGWYRLSMGVMSVGFALVGGSIVFSLLMPSGNVIGFILIAGIPAVIAATVFAHASQRAARRHLAAVTASKPNYAA